MLRIIFLDRYVTGSSFPQRFWAGIQTFLKEYWIPDKSVRG
jgi:hypothetical protein